MLRLLFLSLLIISDFLMQSLSAEIITRQHAGILYIFDDSTRLRRYAMDSEEWQKEIPLGGVPTAAWVDEGGIYVAFGVSLWHFDLNGENGILFRDLPRPVQGLFTDGRYLMVNYSDGEATRFVSMDKSNGGFWFQHEKVSTGSRGTAAAVNRNLIFSRGYIVGKGDLLVTSYRENGSFIETQGSFGQNNDDNNNVLSTNIWVFGDESKVLNDKGEIFTTSTLVQAGSLKVFIKDVVFFGGKLPIVLTERDLVGYDSGFEARGRIRLLESPDKIELIGDHILALYADVGQEQGYRLLKIAVSELILPDLDEGIKPSNLRIPVDRVFLDQNERINLFSVPHSRLFQWNTNTKEWEDGLGLSDETIYVTYDSLRHQVFGATIKGEIYRYDLNKTIPTAELFGALTPPIVSLTMAGEYLLATHGKFETEAFTTFREEDGMQTDTRLVSALPKEILWDESRGRLYHIRDGGSPIEILSTPVSEDGKFSGSMDSPYHGEYRFLDPIRFSPDRSRMVLGNGVVMNMDSLQVDYTLLNEILDAAWIDDSLFTFKKNRNPNSSNPVFTLQKWSGESFALEKEVVLPGEARTVLNVGDRLILVLSIDGFIRFIEVDENLVVLYSFPLNNYLYEEFQMKTVCGIQNISWNTNGYHPEDRFLLEQLNPSSGRWVEVGTFENHLGTFALPFAEGDTVSDYRISLMDRFSYSEINLPLEISHMYNVAWRPPPRGQFVIPYWKFADQEEWIEFKSSDVVTGWMRIQNVPTYAEIDSQVLNRMDTLTLFGEGELVRRDLIHFNWTRHLNDEGGYTLWVNDLEGVWRVIETYDQNTFNVTLPREEFDFALTQFRMTVVTEEGIVEIPLQRSIEIQFEWEDNRENPSIYLLQSAAPQNTWQRVRDIPGHLRTTIYKEVPASRFPQLRVVRVESSEFTEYTQLMGKDFFSKLTWSGEVQNREDLALLERVSPEDEWKPVSQSGILSSPMDMPYSDTIAHDFHLALRQVYPGRFLANLTSYPFEVSIVPVLQTGLAAAGALQISIITEVGRRYVLEHTRDFEEWNETEYQFLGSGDEVVLEIPLNDHPIGYYRMVVRGE